MRNLNETEKNRDNLRKLLSFMRENDNYNQKYTLGYREI